MIEIFFKLFWSFFQIGLFSIGGGYAAMPLIQNQVVRRHSGLRPAGSHHCHNRLRASFLHHRADPGLGLL